MGSSTRPGQQSGAALRLTGFEGCAVKGVAIHRVKSRCISLPSWQGPSLCPAPRGALPMHGAAPIPQKKGLRHCSPLLRQVRLHKACFTLKLYHKRANGRCLIYVFIYLFFLPNVEERPW